MPIGGIFANLFLAHHEKWLEQYPTHFKPVSYHRQVEGTLLSIAQMHQQERHSRIAGVALDDGADWWFMRLSLLADSVCTVQEQYSRDKTLIDVIGYFPKHHSHSCLVSQINPRICSHLLFPMQTFQYHARHRFVSQCVCVDSAISKFLLQCR